MPCASKTDIRSLPLVLSHMQERLKLLQGLTVLQTTRTAKRKKKETLACISQDLTPVPPKERIVFTGDWDASSDCFPQGIV